MKTGRLILSGANSGSYNMAADEALLISRKNGLSPLTLRFYKWTPPAISFGYSQKIPHTNVFDFDIVRRPTGGRAVLHDKELTYSIIAKRDDFPQGDSIVESYKAISVGLMNGLKALSIPVDAVPLRKNKRIKIDEKISSLCFASASTCEITLNGKKLIGSAQRRYSDTFLQHGSILMGIDVEKLSGIFSETSINNYFLLERMTSLNLEGYHPSEDELILSLTREIGNILNIKFEEAPLIQDEIRLTNELLEMKYTNPLWNIHGRQV